MKNKLRQRAGVFDLIWEKIKILKDYMLNFDQLLSV